MASRKSVTSQELIDSLAADPGYQAMKAQEAVRLAAFVAEFADEERVIAAEAKSLGYDIESVWDFVNNTPHPFLPRRLVGPYPRAYPMLVRHLHLPHHPRVREGVVRALTVRDGGELVWQALYQEFKLESDEGMRWVLANALKYAMPYRLRIEHPEIARAHKNAGVL